MAEAVKEVKLQMKKLLNFKSGKRGKIVDEEIIKFQKQ